MLPAVTLTLLSITQEVTSAVVYVITVCITLTVSTVNSANLTSSKIQLWTCEILSSVNVSMTLNENKL